MPGVNDPRPPVRHVTTRKIVSVHGVDARGPRRPRRRGGATRDPRGRPEAAAGRGGDHDADARATRPSWPSGFLRTEGLIDGR